MNILSCVEVNPPGPVQACVIWNHGLGADGHDFEALLPVLDLPDELGLRFVFPHAPARPVTINAGYVMRAWYDITHADLPQWVDEAGIRASCSAIEALMAREIENGVAPERLVLAGFSQGSVIALETALRYSERLAGVLALSCYLPLADKLPTEAHAANRGIPLFLGHGSQDPVIPIAAGQKARAALERLGYAVEWHQYPAPHTVALEEIQDIRAWFLRLFA